MKVLLAYFLFCVNDDLPVSAFLRWRSDIMRAELIFTRAEKPSSNAGHGERQVPESTQSAESAGISQSSEIAQNFQSDRIDLMNESSNVEAEDGGIPLIIHPKMKGEVRKFLFTFNYLHEKGLSSAVALAYEHAFPDLGGPEYDETYVSITENGSAFMAAGEESLPAGWWPDDASMHEKNSW